MIDNFYCEDVNTSKLPRRFTLSLNFRKALSSILIVVFLGALSACAMMTPTRYQPLGEDGGYASRWLSEDSAEIEVYGNEWTRAYMVRELGLLHAAKLAESRGYSHFTITKSERGKSTTGGQIRPSTSYVTNAGYTTMSALPSIPTGWTYLNERLIVQFLYDSHLNKIEGERTYSVDVVLDEFQRKYQ